MPGKPIVYAWIFARGGSKGLPGKNIRSFGGRPLIAHAVDTALQSQLIDRVFVSTDSEEIADVCRKYGADVPFVRPAELASDQAPERLAWRHAVEWVAASELPPMEIMVSLPPTSPLRTVQEVDAGITLFMENKWDTVFAVSRSDRHPSFNVVQIGEDGAVRLVNPPETKGARRQDFCSVYNISTAFYVTTPETVLRTDSLWDGRVGAVEIPVEHAVDIDSELDFEFAEFLLKREGDGNE